MKKEPKRPGQVPSDASWNAEENEWELGQKNKAGQCIGEWRWWAPKGNLVCHTFFDKTGEITRAKRFHPNGEVSREIDAGKKLDVYYRSTQSTSERFGFETEDENVWKAVKRAGYPIEFDYYDREGKHLNPEVTPLELPTPKAQRSRKRRVQQIKRGRLSSDFAAEICALFGDVGETTVLVDTELDARDAQEIAFVEGDLELDELTDWESLGISALVVKGTLTVKNGVRVTDDPSGLLLVTGDLSAENLVTSGGLVVKGDLNVNGCLFGDYNHGSAFIGGNVRARFFHPEEYFFEVVGKSQFEIAFGNSYRLNGNARPKAFTFQERQTIDFLNLLHPDIRSKLDLGVDAYLGQPCDQGVWQYLERNALMAYCLTGNPLFQT